jgi:hypothetical protein
MRVAEGREVLLCAGEVTKGRDGAEQPSPHDFQCLSVLDDRRVVGHESAGGSQMHEAPRLRRHFAEMMHVGHHIVAELALVLGHPRKVDGIASRAHGLDRFDRDRDSEIALDLGQGDPQVAPDERRVLRREDPRHLGRSVSVDQRI